MARSSTVYVRPVSYILSLFLANLLFSYSGIFDNKSDKENPPSILEYNASLYVQVLSKK